MIVDGETQAKDNYGDANPPKANTEVAVIEHDTLKYRLLGPSLTKPGQDTVDQQKVSEIIYNASKGSKFFNNEESRDKNLTQKIEKILARKRQLERIDLASDSRRADEYIAELELSRDLSQTVVHVDCDAFYAAVEELDHPELKHEVRLSERHGRLRRHEALSSTRLPAPQLREVHEEGPRGPPSPGAI
ncbi:MAG: hypothetical protein LQ346_004154 [Caloplaca aetnensis]|nr:MAG: hypothetical protein LQ346_004154 [Caloplaca aetnensis]